MDGLQEKGLLRILMITMTRILLVFLLCLAASCALAAEPGKAQLEMNDISGLLREAEGQAKTLPPLANDQSEVGESRAGALMKQFNAPAYQAKIREEQQRLRETVFKDVIGEFMPQDGTYPPAEASANTERLYLFVSSSVPLATLRTYAAMIDRAKASQVIMVLRGFVGGMKKAGPTMAFIGEILKKDPACDLSKSRCDNYQVNIQIDPERFRRFRIDEVPALAYLTASADDQGQEEALIVTGDASLAALLERINGEAKSPGLQTLIAAFPGGVNQGECQ